MEQIELENNLKEIIELYKNLQLGINDLVNWINKEWKHRIILDEFLDFIWLEKNEETRYIAYSRIANLKEEPLILYIDKSSFIENKIEKIDLSYKYVCDFHSEIQAVLISVIISKKLLTPFYIEIFKWVANVWLAFNWLFLPWRNHIINWINKDLENKFENDTDKIIQFLSENNLFDLSYDWEEWDRSYSALVMENGEYVSKSYVDIFPNEIKIIVEELDIFINNLSNLEDEIYNAKENYINYLTNIKYALLEKDTSKLVEKWSKVDEVWMDIKTPFQICHPLEFYEDKYRKAVAPEWDLRIQNTVFKSDIKKNILNMYEAFYDEIWIDDFYSSYNFSLNSIKRVQLYLSSPVLYYSSEMTWLFSAQVVPNDELVTKMYWKKIFAFPEIVLQNKQKAPFMKIDSVIFDSKLLKDYRKILFWNNDTFYKIYDILTIGHEYGHTLWLDFDTEILMNKKTWIFKNIEEFKATAWGLVMYFFNEELINETNPSTEKLSYNIIIDHIYRCINLLKYRETNEIEPYYCESLIHLDILFESWIISINTDNQITINYNDKNYKKLQKVYTNHYTKIINIYLKKIDAWVFLSDYTIKNNWHYLPKNLEIREFVEYYYNLYKKIWNNLDNISS